jgi:hypothetical protein
MLASAAAASHGKHVPRLRLSLVPLQTTQLGPDNAALPLQWFDSGSVSNDDAAFNAPVFVSPKKLERLGRVTGYLLDYGLSFSGGTGVTEIKTGVDEYRSSPDAKHALAFWEKQDSAGARSLSQLGIDVTFQRVHVPRLGAARFAVSISMSVPNADPVSMVDEQVVDGRFILDTTVDAGTQATALQLVPRFAAVLDHRLRQLRDKHLRGKPARIPFPPDPGPAPGGPDLSTFVVGPADFTGQAIVIDQGYGIDPQSVSSYSIDIKPAGGFGELIQGIDWYANANEATWQGTITGDALAQLAAQGGATKVDVSSVGDNAQALIISGASSGQSSVVFLALWQGQATDLLVVQSSSTVQPADVQSLAQTAANHLNAGLGS